MWFDSRLHGPVPRPIPKSDFVQRPGPRNGTFFMDLFCWNSLFQDLRPFSPMVYREGQQADRRAFSISFVRAMVLENGAAGVGDVFLTLKISP